MPDNTVALQIKPPEPANLNMLGQISAFQTAQAHLGIYNLQAALAARKQQAFREFQQRRAAGDPQAELALLDSGDIEGAQGAQKILQTNQEQQASKQYGAAAIGGDDNALGSIASTAGMDAAKKAADTRKVVQDAIKTKGEVAIQQFATFGQIANGILESAVDGRVPPQARQAAVAQFKQANPGMSDLQVQQFLNLPDDKLIALAKQGKAVAQNAKEYTESSGEAAGNKKRAEVPYDITILDPKQTAFSTGGLLGVPPPASQQPSAPFVVPQGQSPQPGQAGGAPQVQSGAPGFTPPAWPGDQQQQAAPQPAAQPGAQQTQLSPQDRDAVIRTIAGEAGNQAPIGQLAVANVIRNRMLAGNYGGNTAAGVVGFPNAFEAYRNPGTQQVMQNTRPGTPQYEQIGKIVDRAFAGDSDPTGGMTHYYNPDLQAKLGRQPPSWAKGSGLRIGDHVFYSPDQQQQGGAQPRSGGGPQARTEPLAQGWTPEQIAEQEKRGAAIGELPQAIATRASDARQNNFLVDQMRQEASNLPMGKASSIALVAGQYLQPFAKHFGVGDLDKTIDSWNGLQKNFGQLTRQAVHDTSSKAAVQEFVMIQNTLLSNEMTPGGFRAIADQIQGVNDFHIAREKALETWQASHGDSAKGFQADWNRKITPSAFLMNRLSDDDFSKVVAEAGKTPEGRARLQSIYKQMEWGEANGLFEH